MNKIRIAITLIFLTLPVLAQTPSSMITRVSGPAIIITDGQKSPAAPMESLAPKTLVELRGGAEMTVVYFSTGNHEQYTGPCLIGIGNNRGKVFDGEQTARTVSVTDSALVKAIDPTALDETPGSGNLTVTGVARNPKFRWKTDLPAPYTLTIVQPAQAAKPRSILWSKDYGLKDAVYVGPKLDPDKAYVAQVQSGDTVIAKSLFRVSGDSFELLDKAKVEAAEMGKNSVKDPTPHVLLSTAYAQHGQHEKSVAALNSAIQTQPSDATFINRMDTMMGKIKKTADDDTAGATNFYRAQDALWGTDTYYDPEAWAWEDGWD